MATSIDEHCSLKNGEVYQDYNCLLNLVEGKSDKFYVLQLLTNGKDYYVWTRWGRNGTDGQNKLEGPLKKQAAEKTFQKKFQDKTKNKWENKDSFEPKKGKYTLVEENIDDSKPSTSQSVQNLVEQQKNVDFLANVEAEKPDLSPTIISGVNLNGDLLYQIMFHLTTKDVLKCMLVCRFWKEVLSEKYFWKVFICHCFNLELKTDIQSEGPYGCWSVPEKWYSYLDDEDDPYVMRPFPTMWKCGVIHPSGLDPLSGDVKSLQGFSRSLEILTRMKKEVDRWEIVCGRQCSSSEGEDSICVVLFPWEKQKLLTVKQLTTQIFHFHPEVVENSSYIFDTRWKRRKLYYHLPNENEEDAEDEDQDHDLDEKPCLNQIFGFGYDYEGGQDPKKVNEFYKWLQNIMVPSLTVLVGSEKFNPVAAFSLTQLAPGWVGGALSGVTHT